MRNISKLIAFALLCLLIMGGTAAARLHHHRSTRLLTLPQTAAEIAETGTQVAPIAYVKFCLRYEDQCQATGSGERIELTRDVWANLSAVNANVNGRIHPNSAKDGFDWSLETVYGNCNDYAVQKRQTLLEQGLPMSALSLSVVRTAWGEGHLVLTVRTDRGDYVLDNLRPNILPWNRTGYDWLKLQSAADPGNWVAASASPSVPLEHPAISVASRQQRLQTGDLSPRLYPTSDLISPADPSGQMG